ncbi:hypothetical protein HPB49_010422 [Dermacentor silvarum]|uniref:Uncharacterized protein n=1 Tax=Dermacentor silvarum TaxID=543639 RepID=A0ACB8DCC7_DERSI|nr:hypothetical protein HPB49_010422 [Dermacentor silvarum]
MNKLYIGNLPADVNEGSIRELFHEQTGAVPKSVLLKKGGYAFVECADDLVISKAIEALNGKTSCPWHFVDKMWLEEARAASVSCCQFTFGVGFGVGGPRKRRLHELGFKMAPNLNSPAGVAWSARLAGTVTVGRIIGARRRRLLFSRQRGRAHMVTLRLGLAKSSRKIELNSAATDDAAAKRELD